jgi:hypothetical protein
MLTISYDSTLDGLKLGGGTLKAGSDIELSGHNTVTTGGTLLGEFQNRGVLEFQTGTLTLAGSTFTNLGQFEQQNALIQIATDGLL